MQQAYAARPGNVGTHGQKLIIRESKLVESGAGLLPPQEPNGPAGEKEDLPTESNNPARDCLSQERRSLSRIIRGNPDGSNPARSTIQSLGFRTSRRIDRNPRVCAR